MREGQRRRVQRGLLGGLTLLIVASLWWVWHWQLTRETRDAIDHAESRLALYSSSLEGALQRFTYLPDLLARQPLVRNALSGDDTTPASRVNAHLARVAERSGAEAIYLMNDRGVTLAASNHDSPQSFVGHRYHYRPYFIEAMRGKQGEFFAVGSTTGRPGYFVSAPVYASGDAQRIIGALAVKISLESLQEDWRRADEKVLLSDANGVVILSSRPAWRFRRLGALDAAALETIRAQRQFVGNPLAPLGHRLADGSLLIGAAGVGERFFTQASPLGELGWTMHYLVPVRPLYASARNAVLASAAVWLALVLLGLWLRERQQRLRLRLREASIMREANERLEIRVAERTRELESAQAELVQAGKLAALGTMAAGIAHELNQPLAGIRTYAASGARLIERGRQSAAADNFQRIQTLSDRLATLIRQLKLFARKGGAREPVDLLARLDFVLELLGERLSRQDVALHLDLPDEASRPVWVAGDDIRLEQLLTNLLRNALDALREVDSPCLEIGVALEGERVVLTVTDNGPGIEAQTLKHLFDPFFTTKRVGDGLGLGLFISYGIVQDLDGRIRADNRPASQGGGAHFRVELPGLQGATPARPARKETLT
ncbi:sensor histidine kinase [Modicisalibacter xianhensis]|uniref:C4-dicarboxylate transport sensor protein DctB n=1 Tax=Modicisalibacter xianhensis TaxID=442341 RepID=A0A1I3AW02_9GAMM|nr:ATP-binding protein [Halomonas xianhensis]SFH53956.1 two-component system, NtrC family, C4-dicarboxylate transport sensor histidine kinase DctB [Halomonas xianhensis]